jgi:hypothetical protein
VPTGPEGAAVLPLVKGRPILVDAEFAHLANRTWVVDGRGLARCAAGYRKQAHGRKYACLHEFILGVPWWQDITFLNGDKRDYRRANLSVVPEASRFERRRRLNRVRVNP